MIYSSTTFMNTNTHTNKKVGQVSRPPHLENRVKCIGKILFTCLELGNNAKLCFTNELHDILNLRTIRHLVNNLVDSIEYACLSVEHQKIGICDVRNHLFVYAVVAKYGTVYTTVAYRVVGS